MFLGACGCGACRKQPALSGQVSDLCQARFAADAKAKGRPRSALDATIAAVAEANGCIVVTVNERDFGDAGFIKPLRAGRG
jgi:predicted nucleic acid-binding protein